MKHKEFCEWVFVKNDIYGNPCHIGDTIKITQPRIQFRKFYENDTYEYIDVPEKTFEGTLVILKSKGLMLRFDDGTYRHITSTNHARNPLKWELLK
jgi:hypothetical protein